MSVYLEQLKHRVEKLEAKVEALAAAPQVPAGPDREAWLKRLAARRGKR